MRQRCAQCGRSETRNPYGFGRGFAVLRQPIHSHLLGRIPLGVVQGPQRRSWSRFLFRGHGIMESLKVPGSERQQFVLRLDTFNTFNHPVFNGPSSATIFDTSQFGCHFHGQYPRVLQVALRYEF